MSPHYTVCRRQGGEWVESPEQYTDKGAAIEAAQFIEMDDPSAKVRVLAKTTMAHGKVDVAVVYPVDT